MKKSTILKVSAAPTVIGLALMAAPAFAQIDEEADPGIQPAEGVDGDELGTSAQPIIVTGSRIKQPNLDSASPVTVVSNEEFAITGTTRVEDLVNSLPQVFASESGQLANGATGAATINLRGIGTERTLVLINGRRLMPGDPTTAAPDINVIPAVMVERVDVLTGGASSVYGADAVAGVVNFVMDTDFEGFKLDAQYSVYNHNQRNRDAYIAALEGRGFAYPSGTSTNGGTFDATLAFGTSFDDGRGRATAYIGYRNIKAVTQASRDYSACALSANTAGSATPYSCGGSLTSPTGTAIYYDTVPDFTGPDGEPDGIDDFTSTLAGFGPGRSLAAFQRFNFGPFNYYQRPDERYTAGVFTDYEISPALHPYAEFMFMDDRTVAQIAPSGDFGNTLSINCDNPLLGADQFAALCDTENLLVSADPNDAFSVVGNTPGATPFNFIDPTTGATYNRGFLQLLRRNVEGGPRRDDLQHVSYRAVFGLRGDLSPAWSYDAYYQYGRTNFSQTYTNDLSIVKLTRALDVVTGPDGTPVCRSTLDGTDPSCVPWDIFSPGDNPPSAESTAYLVTAGLSRGIVSTQVASAYLSGALGEYGVRTPWASEGVGLVIGAEWREESLEFYSDASFQAGDLSGQGAATLPVSGKFDVKEIFTEVRLPLVQDSWLDDFTITAGYRYSDYSTGATTDTYKIEGELSPTPDFTIRGGYNRAVRAPTVQDLFAPIRVALNGSTDPCADFVITAADTGCLAQGLSVGQIVGSNPAEQYNGLIGGNPDLTPEIADTYTAGVVLTPTFLPGFSASVDWFKIDLEDAIQGYGQDTILGTCTRTADPFFCGLINRDGSGSIWRSNLGYVEDIQYNVGGIGTEGVDVQAGYSSQIGDAGRLSLSFVGTYLMSLTLDPGFDAAPEYDCAGLFGNTCSAGILSWGPNPEWRHQARVGFDFANGFGTSVRWRYYGAVDNEDGVAGGPFPGNPPARPGNAGFDAVNYFDLALTYEIGDNYAFRLGANNIFDKEPPLVGSQSCPSGPCNGNTYAATYDALGRYIYAGVTLEF
ncbi:TonB-dependent receptor domain-containing protein [Qipengyuania sphaerica]|uniref:TonB-dependent receptor domain-containing protein n=1 Tax=Qipengyuania sphaerica TaxID=2867243 RepID=UPI001C87B979|nr:TonB-dependent receptor [Qipengyuania sphaerica]MBX7539959.1 TonB-dependent receptor [Qipengyuania sphaerica]